MINLKPVFNITSAILPNKIPDIIIKKENHYGNTTNCKTDDWISENRF
jgi:hypothetical protein